jgi:hypothetical protein
MYGEDIDLSYRILKAGYQNVYFAETQIIHYKGESTKKGSMNYVFIFYQAMQIFARKHFSSSQARLYSTLINGAIWARAGISVVNRLLQAIVIPAVDAGLMFGGMYYLKLYWEHNHRFVQGGHYPPEFMHVAVPAYVLVWLTAIFFSGGYDKPAKSLNLLRGLTVGTLLILALYGLLSESYRFSRALILLGAAWGAVALPVWRYTVQYFAKITLLADAKASKRRAIIGSLEEFERIQNLLAKSGTVANFTGWISPNDSTGTEAIGRLDQLIEIIRIYRIDEVIFCARDLSAQQIMQYMSMLQPLDVEIKIAPPESLFVIGSNSINTQGEWYTIQVNTIALPGNKRLKRLFDITSSLAVLLASPVLIWVQKKPLQFLKNAFFVVAGMRTWVGYNSAGSTAGLPALKTGILPATAHIASAIDDEATIARINFLYAKEYRVGMDVEIWWKNIRRLG